MLPVSWPDDLMRNASIATAPVGTGSGGEGAQRVPREVAEVAVLVHVAAEPADANVVLLVGVLHAEADGLPAMTPEQRRHLPAGDRPFDDRRPLVLAGRRLLDAHRGAGVGALARRHVLDMNEAAIEDQLDGKLVGDRLTGAHRRRGVRDRSSERVLEDIVGEERERLALVAIPGGGAARSGEAVEGDGLADPVALAVGRTGDAARPGVAERRVRRENTGRSVPVALRRHRPIAAPKLDIDPLEVAQQCLADANQRLAAEI